MEIGPAEEVFFHAKNPYTQKLNSSNPLPDPKAERAKHSLQLDQSDIPSPSEILQGCPFAGRCPHTTEQCSKLAPELKEVSPNHFSACHLN